METEHWVRIGITSISVVGCVFIIVVYYKFAELQVFAFTVIKDLAVLSLLYCSSPFIPGTNDIGCEIQGILINFFGIQVVLWTSFISLTLYLKVIKQKRFSESKFRKRSLVIVVALGVIGTLLPFTDTKFKENPYGKTGPWCWIKDDSDYHNGCLLYTSPSPRDS